MRRGQILSQNIGSIIKAKPADPREGWKRGTRLGNTSFLQKECDKHEYEYMRIQVILCVH